MQRSTLISTSADFKLIREKQLDKNATLKITQNHMSGRIFVEFRSDVPRITLQRNFQDSIFGKMESERFAKSIKNTDQLIAYFGRNK